MWASTWRRRWRVPAAGLALCLIPALPAAADPPDLRITLQSADAWVGADAPLELEVSGSVPVGARLAVMIGDTDWTALFEATGHGLRYHPTSVRLPSGERPLVVYLVTASRWDEVARFQLRVLTRGGFERADVAAAVELTNKGQVALGRFPGAPPTPRDTFQDLTVGLGLTSTFVRGGWSTTAQANAIGVTNRPEALRFAERQNEAPRIDLASYLVSADSGRARFSLGHISFGTHRHLLNGFASRGALAAFRLGTRADFSLAMVNGSPIVGWSNPIGIADSDHRVAGATFGVELAPRPGGARLEASLLDARLLPRSGFNQGSIVDAERNRGIGLRLVASDRKQRIRLDGGLARTRFANPDDPLLAGGATLVPVRAESRDARYLDVAYALLQRPRASLSTAFRHELVQPLFGSLQGFVRPDILQNVMELNGTFAGVALQASGAWSHDNLDEVSSILTTFTRAQQLNVALPLAALAAGPASGVLPTVSYGLHRIHQYGGGLPVNGDFQETHVPDQVSANQTLAVEWLGARWRAAYRLNRSLQDNRQVGRDRADLANLTNTISFGLASGPQLDLGVDIGFEGAENRETARTDVTRRVSVNGNWRPSTTSTLTALLAVTMLANDLDAAEARNTDVSLQFTQTVPLVRRPAGRPSAQFFVRYARLTGRTFNPAAATPDVRRFWTVNTGVTASLF